MSASKNASQKSKTKKCDRTLCWGCANAVPSYRKGTGCSWSKYFKPVEGWTAEKTELTGGYNQKVTSYLVSECPEYKKG